MKLVNYSLWRLCIILAVVITLFTIAFYFIQKYEIGDSVDEGLEECAQEFIYHSLKDSAALQNPSKYNTPLFNLQKTDAIINSRYIDTSLFFASEGDLESMRMYETGFTDKNTGQQYRLQVFNPDIESDDLIESILTWLAFLLCTILVTMFLYSRLFNRVWKPFYSLLNQLSSFKLNHSKEINMPSSPISEFNQLNKSVKKLLHENIEVYEDQKQFIENSSHELQTPLAIITGKLELLLEDENLTGDQIQKIDDILNIASRMKHLNSNLLLTSKIKNKQFNNDETICLNNIFNEILHTYDDLIKHQSISVEKQENVLLNVQMNYDLAFMLASNLVKNAMVHNINGGSISIVFDEKRIEISNTGKAGPIIAEKMFQRYYQQTDNTYSMGLGLSLVKSIVDYYSFKIDYSFKSGKHFFVLNFT